MGITNVLLGHTDKGTRTILNFREKTNHWKITEMSEIYDSSYVNENQVTDLFVLLCVLEVGGLLCSPV